MAAHRASLFMGFHRQEHWSELLFPSPGDLPYPGIEPESPALAVVFCLFVCFFTTSSTWEACSNKVPVNCKQQKLSLSHFWWPHTWEPETVELSFLTFLEAINLKSNSWSSHAPSKKLSLRVLLCLSWTSAVVRDLWPPLGGKWQHSNPRLRLHRAFPPRVCVSALFL